MQECCECGGGVTRKGEASGTARVIAREGGRKVAGKKSRHGGRLGLDGGANPHVMLWLYRILFLPVLLISAPRYLWRMRRRGGYAEKFSQRFGAEHELPAKRAGVRRVWLQAVSVGEMLAIGPLIEALQSDGSVEVYLTTTTSTGFRVADERYQGKVLGIGYFPIDWWLFSRRAWAKVAPDLAILAEGERWPEHMHQATRRGVPVVCINARLSDRSFRRLRTCGVFRGVVLGGITRLLPSSTQDEQRFRELGVPAERMVTTGNIKLDLQIAPLAAAERAKLREELGLGEGLVLLGSSTWPGEEAALVKAWREVRARGVRCALLIAPRHAERRMEIERLMREEKLTHHLRSRGPAAAAVDVAIADTTGELRKLTQLADLVFVGKSLPPNEGGQTPVEAAALEKPILFGPAMSNFRMIAEELVARRAAKEVVDAAGLEAEVLALLADEEKRLAMARAAGEWRRENAGAIERTARVIREELGRCG